jgi:hypothetical protein
MAAIMAMSTYRQMTVPIASIATFIVRSFPLSIRLTLLFAPCITSIFIQRGIIQLEWRGGNSNPHEHTGSRYSKYRLSANFSTSPYC